MGKLCEHRHTIESHPNCFIWYKQKGQRVGYLDIEASGLKADTDKMLSWAIIDSDKNLLTDWVQTEDMFVKTNIMNPDYDFRIVGTLVEAMKQFTVLVTYYGTGFDIPFIRTRAMHHWWQFPRVGTIKHIDLYYHVRNKMKLYRNSLAVATQHLGIAGKTHLDFSYWRLAAMGDPDGMKELVNHNIKDVEILRKLHKRLEPYCKFNQNSI